MSFSRDYWISADSTAIKAEALREHMVPLIAAAKKAFGALEERLEFVEEGQSILPGIEFNAAYGHTPGHVIVSISSGGRTAYNISDVVVHHLFMEHPEWSPAIDMDAENADKCRRSFYKKAAAENALVFAHHLGPFPNFGRISQAGESWRWEPIDT